ncbi:hypothetical protein ALC62_01038 [Cyphomyrmex costatus]|uniref:Helix-turn-helix domain-containing protein n=1 Tax=Cyphomyrmex costatus TaxID=456900 RepID=A0A151IPN7_9HYME|nr:hypothetical protein ALC62_01038 [Cyphomyrmex costatus]
MEDLETKILSTINVDIPIYQRYVDDILIAIPKLDIKKVFDTFNSYNERINFTMECGIDGWMNFLDVKVGVENDRIIFDVYKKPTNSGRYLNFFSNHPMCHKKGVIISLIDRIILLSHPKFHSNNITELIRILIGNGYPLKFLFSCINDRINSLKYYNINRNSIMNNGIKRKNNYLVVPYHKNVSEKFKNIINIPNTDIAYKPINNLSSIIKTGKDKLDKFDNTNVVYKINCKDCDMTYVGQTKRRLKTRLKEHRDGWKRINNTSVVSKHQVNCNHDIDWDNTAILDNEPIYFKRSISEMIHIKNQTNSLNLQSDTEKLPQMYYSIITNTHQESNVNPLS